SAMTGLAGITDDLARAATTRTGLLDGEKSLLHADLARTMAGSTGFWPATTFRTAALTGTAFHMRRHTNFDVRAAHRIFQVKLQGLEQITAAVGTGTPAAPATTEDIANAVAKNITEAGTATEAPGAARCRGIHTGMPELVVGRPAVGVRQHFIRFACFLELVFCLFIARIPVRVILHGKAPIRLFDFFFVRRLGNTQYFVIIALCHNLSCHHYLPRTHQPNKASGT